MHTPKPKTTKAKSSQEEDDAVTEPPEDPPASHTVFEPMPRPGPEVDCVRDQLLKFHASWEATKQIILNTLSAYGYPVRPRDISINDEKTQDAMMAEVDAEFKSTLQIYALTRFEPENYLHV